MRANEERFTVSALCRVLGVARSGCHAWKRRGESPRDGENRRLDADIRRIFSLHKGRYGAPRLAVELRVEGWQASRRRVAKRMQALGLRAKAAKKFKATTQSKHNLPEQDFSAAAANQKWAADITYVWTEEGWLYLAVMLDLYSRAVVGFGLRRADDAGTRHRRPHHGRLAAQGREPGSSSIPTGAASMPRGAASPSWSCVASCAA
ncbi:Putative transposase InsK for insertion sequence element IS150 [Myxococcaceae bacterium]|nr:Putative transposase InsK for insertion sequence element IS150 [Myxococcaceae bacterium]